MLFHRSQSSTEHTIFFVCTHSCHFLLFLSLCKQHRHPTLLTRGSNGDSIYAGEFLRGAHFDDDVPAALQAQVARCAGCRHIKGNPVVLCGDGQLVRAHLVGCVTVGNHPICTHHHSWEGEHDGKSKELLRTDRKWRKRRCDATRRHTPVMSISLMVSAAMLSVISVAGIPSATAS